MSKKVRIQFELSETGAQELERLIKICGVSTRKDLINSALTLLAWAVAERKSGRIIASVDEKNGKYKEIQMPVLGLDLMPENPEVKGG